MNSVDTEHVLVKPRTDAACLDTHWMPFTGNRDFKKNPRMILAAEG